MGDVVVYVDRLGIAAHLSLCLLHGRLDLRLRGMTLQVLQLDDIGVLHVGINLMERTQEDVGIAVLVVQLGDGTVEAALARQGKGVAMHEGFPLLAVTLGSVGIDAVRYVLEERLEVATICHQLFLLADVVALKGQIVLLIGFQKISKYLLANYFVGNGESLYHTTPSAGESDGGRESLESDVSYNLFTSTSWCIRV